MTKAEIVNRIVLQTKIERSEVLKTIEAFMGSVKDSLTEGENVYLRGFGTFMIKKRKEKPARIITKDEAIIIPAHEIPSFKPSKVFVNNVKIANNKG